MLPVLGTVLVLLAQRGNSLFTAPAVLQHLGDWSYSIYLWHWPIAVALAYGGWQNEMGLVALGMGFSLLLGWLSFRWVEPLGRARLAQWRSWPALAVFGAVTVLVALPALGIRLLQGEILNVRVRPLIAMECTVMAPRYMGLGTGEAAYAKFSQLKDACRAVNGCFTLLWHNSQFETKAERDLYEAVLQ